MRKGTKVEAWIIQTESITDGEAVRIVPSNRCLQQAESQTKVEKRKSNEWCLPFGCRKTKEKKRKSENLKSQEIHTRKEFFFLSQLAVF